jgi:hypothetical protein
MKKHILKKIWIMALIGLFTFLILPYKANWAGDDIDVNWFDIIPELKQDEISDVNEKIETIWSEWWKVREKYNETASSPGFTTSKQVASWIMNWDTIMNYLVFIVQFLSQLGLVVWAGFIIYAGYKYMASSFSWGKVPSSTVTNAIIWILIVIFSYAIMKILTSFIWLS